MKTLTAALAAALLALWTCAAWAQAPSPDWLQDWGRDHIALNHTGMAVLLGWSVLNLGGGLAGSFNGEGSWRAFHQMNAAWNLVNLGIAGWALLDMTHQDVSSMTALSALASGEKMEKIFLFNAGLDIAYMVGGGWLWQRGAARRSPRQEGFGQSILLQGTFLLCFDAAMWWLNYDHDQRLYLQLQGQALTLGLSW